MKQLKAFVAPRNSDEVPVGQAVQDETSEAAMALDHVFAGQRVQPPDEAGAEYVPAGHWKGAAPPPGQFHPSGQGVVSLDVPGGQKVPFVQMRHVALEVAPVSREKYPPGHSVGSTEGADAVAGQKYPATQSWHVAEEGSVSEGAATTSSPVVPFEDANVPGGHGLQKPELVAPVEGEKKPARHGTGDAVCGESQ